jgi:hypothetical protein
MFTNMRLYESELLPLNVDIAVFSVGMQNSTVTYIWLIINCELGCASGVETMDDVIIQTR